MTDSNGNFTPDNSVGSAAAPVARNTTNYIIASVFEMLCCGGIFGLISLILSILAKGDFDRGDTTAGESKLRITKILLIIGLVLGLIAVTVAIVANVFAAKSGLTTTTTYHF